MLKQQYLLWFVVTAARLAVSLTPAAISFGVSFSSEKPPPALLAM